MRTNYFECPVCGKITRHIEITESEWLAVMEKRGRITGGGILSDIIVNGTARLVDLTGFAKTVNSITGRCRWKCCGCTHLSLRKENGDIIDD